MRRLIMVLLGGVAVSIFLFGCKEGPQGPAGTPLIGNLHGKVMWYDSTAVFSGFAEGVQVTAEGTAYSGNTDSSGAWVLEGLPTGTYNIVYLKAGYSVMKTPQFQFVGGTDYYIPTIIITPLPTFEAETAIASISAGNLDVTGTIDGGTPAYARRIILFIGKESPVSSTIPSSYVAAYGPVVLASQNNYSFSTPLSGLIPSYGFVAGDTIHVAVYSLSNYVTGYADPASGHIVFSSVGKVGQTSSAGIP